MPSVQCPPRNVLKDYLAGRLQEEDSAVLEHHLIECSTCEQTATNLEAEPDTLVEALRGEPDDEAGAASAAFDTSRAANWAKRLLTGPMTNHNTPTAFVQNHGDVGSYELLEQLGRGGMGTVYLARHRQLDKRVAIKLLPLLSAQDDDKVARFQREMRAAGKLEHPAIVRATDAGEEHGVHFLVMEAIDGLDLSALARLTGRLSVADACEIARQAAIGLSHAHSQGVVHRDIKPSNLMLDSQGCIKILDFGLAQISLWEEASAEITTVGQLMGTLDYMAPEQAERGGAVDYRADLYSLAATLYRLLAGRPPLAASPHLSPLEKLRLLAEHQAPKLDVLRENVPRALVALLNDMLARDPSKRPPSAAHVAERLTPLANGSNLPALLTSARQTAANEPAPPMIAQDSANLARASAAPLLRGGSNWIDRTLRWTAAGMLPLLLFAGLYFVIETSKGQLVIESDVGEIQVKLVEGEEEVQDLQIVPGTQSTRLRGGKYEIVLDAPSDRFSVSNQQFTIRNGETVVARITAKAGETALEPVIYSEARPNAQMPVSQPLNEISYQGESLDTWLRKFKYEKDPIKFPEAVRAICTLSEPEVKEKIVPAIKEFLSSNRIAETVAGNSSALLQALRKMTGKDYVTEIVDILDHSPDIRTLMQLGLNPTAQSPDKLKPLLEWTDRLFARTSVSTEDKLAAAEMLRTLLYRENSCPECVPVVVEHLKTHSALTADNFWLAFPDGSPDSAPVYSPPMRDEMLRRVVEVLSQPDSEPELIARAAMVATSTFQNGGHFDANQLSELLRHLGKSLESAALTRDQSPRSPTIFFPIKAFDPWACPMIKGLEWFTPDPYAGNPPTTSEIALLNLIQTFGWQKELQANLQELQTACESDSQTGRNSEIERFYNDSRSDSWKPLILKHRKMGTLDEMLDRIIFLQTGSLLGKDVAKLATKQLRPSGNPRDAILIQPNMTLAIYIPELLPAVKAGEVSNPPVIQAGAKPPVWGVPIRVAEDGTIFLPYIERLTADGFSPRDLEEVIRRNYQNQGIFKEDGQNTINVSVSILLNPGEELEVRAVTGPEPVPPQE